jgi:hypothetical protein
MWVPPKCEPEAKIATKAWARIAPKAGRHDRHSASARAHATLPSLAGITGSTKGEALPEIRHSPLFFHKASKDQPPSFV